ncbi:MAG: bifunctional diaminohydroxyphosphoribosylaminopyrimidine deaminase/5-amino-6-(5-phosphoribosylamino)uracil reductase RibD [Bacteroidetes bacterium]|nr:bifunctional diaminohydroxyphosphoribosylaminopyrimidine deaminase/5-amino-6-(5-phosphoribosylamino)uracil reductase RibD [Bacteroidota bacterium]
MNLEEKYMQRCLEIATLGLGNTAPNPMVGSVIVYDNDIIGEGFHQKFGEAHAEVNAINSVVDKSNLSKATLYVNLEPCSHYGKTPPCADLIIEYKIPKVVIGCIDSFSEVSGKGVEKLINAGIEVVTGVLERESRELNQRFFTFHEKKRPYIILKWAQTKDGFIDIIRNKDSAKQPTWITGDSLKTLVHKWRTEEQSIMVGTNTALKDNPQLTARKWQGKNPLRIVLDRNLSLTKSLFLFDNETETLVFTSKESTTIEKTTFVNIDFSKNILPLVLNELYNRDIQSLIVEGGTHLLQSFIDFNLWDEARVLIGDKYFANGVKAPILNESLYSTTSYERDELQFYKNSKLEL